MALLTLQNWHADDDGSPRAGATVTYKVASASEPNANPVLGTTTTNASGRWQFTGVPDGDYDVYLVDGTTKKIWKGLASLPLSFSDAQVADAADIQTTKINQSTIDDTVDPATVPTTLAGRLNQVAALLKRLGGGTAFNAPSMAFAPRNALPNGDFGVWQRGTSFVALATGAYAADRWQLVNSSAASVTVARDTSVPAVGANAINTPYSMKLTVGTADASVAAGDLLILTNDLEGYDYRALTNGFALSFWVKAHRTGTYCVSFINSGGDRGWIAEYTISVADTWEYKTVVVTTPPTAGTWDYATGRGLRVGWCLMAGSNSQGTGGSWQTTVGGKFATSNQINGVAAVTDTFSLALVNLIPGQVAQPLLPIPYADQLARCQRYFEILVNNLNENVGIGQATSTTVSETIARFQTEKGGNPTINISAVGHFSAYTAALAAQVCTNLTAANLYPHGVRLEATVGAAVLVAGNASLLQATNASAVLSAEWNPA